MSMQLNSIKRKNVIVYNIDLNVIKYVVHSILNNKGLANRTDIVLIPLDEVTINVNIPENKYSHIYKIFNKCISYSDNVANIRSYIHDKNMKTNISHYAMHDVASMLNSYIINYKSTGVYNIKSTCNIVIEKKKYVNDEKYWITSYRNMLTDEEVFTKYMNFKRHVIISIFAGLTNCGIMKLIKLDSKLKYYIINFIVSALLSYKVILSYYSKKPNIVVKRIIDLASSISQLIS